MSVKNIFKGWKTSLIGVFCLFIGGAYPLIKDGAGWEITAIFLVVGIVLLLSPDKAKKAINKVIDSAEDKVQGITSDIGTPNVPKQTK